MKTWKSEPADANVAKYVDCYWFLQKQPGDGGPAFPKLNPDPSAHLILCDPRLFYRYQKQEAIASGCGSHLILPSTKTLVMDHREPFSIVGVKLRVGALYSLRLLQAESEAAHVLPLESLPLPQIDSAILMSLVDEKFGCRDYLDGQLQPFLGASLEDRHSTLVRDSLRALGAASIADACAELSCSRRTLERNFLQVTQLTLKQYLSMNKLEAVLNFLYEEGGAETDWSDVAARFGFSDQPHLIRYLKSSIGATPVRYMQQRDLAIDAYGNFG